MNEPMPMPIVLPHMYYNKQFDPSFTIGLYLRQLDIAQSMQEEIEMAKGWNIYVRVPSNPTVAYPLGRDLNNPENKESNRRPSTMISMNMEEHLLKTIEDSDTYVDEDSTLVLRKKPEIHCDIDAQRAKKSDILKPSENK